MDFNSLGAEAFFDFGSSTHSSLFENCQWVWEGLRNLDGYFEKHLQRTAMPDDSFRRPLRETLVFWRGRIWHKGYEILGGDVNQGRFRVRLEGEEAHDASVLYAGSVLWDDEIMIGAGSVVEPGALIQGPTIIGAQTEIRQGAYVRGRCIIGSRCVVGHTTEIKGSIMLDDAKAGHFAYIGDSILGHATNLGAGTKLANLKLTPGTVRIKAGTELLDTGLSKFGAVLGDHVKIGCNAVTNPGTLLAKGCRVLPVTSVPSGYHEPESLLR